MAILREYEKLAAAKGWAKGTFWGRMIGEAPTEIIGEWDYPDPATLQQEFAEFECPEMEELFGGLDELVLIRPMYTELLEAGALD